MPRILLAILWLGLLLAPPAFAGEDGELGIGDPAPSIDVAHWIKGVDMDARGNFEPLTDFEPGHVYVLEFWATWCGPCRHGMPHLSELQETFRDRGVTIVGISDESLPKVISFLWTEDADGRLQNDRTHYTLATDPDRSVYEDYMKAAGQNGIPTAFVVGKDGKVEWIGHPMLLEDVLEAVVGDTWDREPFKEEFARQRRLAKAMEDARSKISAAAMSGDWGAVVGVIDELLAIDPENDDLQMQKLHLLLTKLDDADRAYAYAKQVASAHDDDAGVLNGIAWTIVDDEEVKHRDLDFALQTALRASELEENEDGAILDTVARVYYEKGDLAKAIEWEAKAVEKATGTDLKAQVEEVLAKYEKEAASPAEEEEEPAEPEDR